jgi:hypothetical protein
MSELLSIDERVAQSMLGVLKVVRNGAIYWCDPKRNNKLLAAATELGKSAKWSRAHRVANA